MKYVLTYESAPEFDRDLVRANFQAHRARWEVFQRSGSLLMIGPFADPRQGAMAIFTTRQAAEEFAATDPFVLNGVVPGWTITEWNEALADVVE